MLSSILSRGTAFLALALALTGAGCLRAQDEKPLPASPNYQKLFFPEGLQAKVNDFTGRREIPHFEILAEAAAVAVGISAVVFALHLENPAGDGDFDLRLGTVANGEAPRALESKVLSEALPVWTEFPGNVLEVRARLNAYDFSPGQRGLHVNLWAVLAGSGSVSGASDLFFAIGQDGALVPALELTGTSRNSNLGSSEGVRTDSHISLADLNDDGVRELVVETLVGSAVAASAPERSVNVYRFDDSRYRPVQIAEPSLLAARDLATELERCSEIPQVRLDGEAER